MLCLYITPACRTSDSPQVSRHQNVCKLKFSHGQSIQESRAVKSGESLDSWHLSSSYQLSTEDIPPRFTKLVKYPKTCLSTNSDCQSRVNIYQLDILKIPAHRILESYGEIGLLTPSSRRRIESNLDVAIISEQYATLGCQGGRI